MKREFWGEVSVYKKLIQLLALNSRPHGGGVQEMTEVGGGQTEFWEPGSRHSLAPGSPMDRESLERFVS